MNSQQFSTVIKQFYSCMARGKIYSCTLCVLFYDAFFSSYRMYYAMEPFRFQPIRPTVLLRQIVVAEQSHSTCTTAHQTH